MIRNMLLFKNKTVLFAEDDNIIRANMIGILVMLFGKVLSAADGEEAYKLYQKEAPDIILTDIKMPKNDGINLIRQIRKHDYETPIILLSSFAEQELLIHAADLSIDGYLIKPIEPEKLSHSICKAIQRTHKHTDMTPLSKELFYNAATKELYKNGNVVVLGVKEQELLQLLIQNRHKTVTKEKIGKVLWPLNPACNSAVKNIILRVRKKLEIDIITSVRGIGYRLNVHKTQDLTE
ncbi:response regulator transcription factor [bacterium]|nr:response regulator transcription factor [bacterium]MBU1883157.1 response regulator transcription factor [bacterium]